jgi:hypothetical protein
MLDPELLARVKIIGRKSIMEEWLLVPLMNWANDRYIPL